MRYEELEEWFARHVERYKREDPNGWMRRKERHTHAVVRNAQRLCAVLGWGRQETAIARTVALLHDVGRFEQMRRYGTFRDDLSEDHAELGLKTIEKEGLLEGMGTRERTLITTAIYWHNKPEHALPRSLDEASWRQVKLIRDADKIDIIKVVHETEQEENKEALSTASGVDDEERLSDHVRELVMRGEDIKKQELHTSLDNKAFMLNWIHQFYYDQSVKVLSEQGHYEEMLQTIPEEYAEVKRRLREAYERKLSEAS